jgi:type IV secretion system protein VirB10
MSRFDYDHLDGVSLVAAKRSNFARNVGFVALGLVMVGGLVLVNWPGQRLGGISMVPGEATGDERFDPPVFPLQQKPLQPVAPPEAVTVPEEPSQSATVEEMPPPDDTDQADAERDRAELERQMREEEAARQAQEEEAARQAAHDAMQERFQSDQMITVEADGGSQDGGTVATEADNQVVQVPGADSDPNKAFLAQSEQNRITPAIASKAARPDALIAQGTLIRGFLETAINSDLPGMIRAVVRENVYSLDGRRVLVPKGSRLVGEYKSGLSRGQKRVFVVWNRIVMSDGTQVDIASPGADNIGQAGLTGKVDTHWAERVGSAMFFSILGSGAQIGTALALDKGNDTPRTVTTTDPVTGIITTTTLDSSGNRHDGVMSAVTQGTSGFTQLATESAQNSENIPPTVHVDQGADVTVFVRRDLDFSKLYTDPLQDELHRLRKGAAAPRRPASSTAEWYPPRPVYK